MPDPGPGFEAILKALSGATLKLFVLRRGFNSVNMREGYPVLEIRTPQEVIAHEET